MRKLLVVVTAVSMLCSSAGHAQRAGEIVNNAVGYRAVIVVDSLVVVAQWQDESLTLPSVETETWRSFSFAHFVAKSGREACHHKVRVNAKPESMQVLCGQEMYRFDITVVDAYRGLITLFTLDRDKLYYTSAAERVEELCEYTVTRVDANGKRVEP